jgi:hypothetical protein
MSWISEHSDFDSTEGESVLWHNHIWAITFYPPWTNAILIYRRYKHDTKTVKYVGAYHAIRITKKYPDPMLPKYIIKKARHYWKMRRLLR